MIQKALVDHNAKLKNKRSTAGFRFSLELLSKLKLESLQVITRLIVNRLRDADFKGAHR